MSKALVAAQIGCGHFAQEQHGSNLKRNPHVSRIKWACDIVETNAKIYADRFHAEKVTNSFKEACSDPEVDFIMIATSHEAHVPIIECAAAHGKHIFCEKPMAMNELQAYSIIRAVRKGDVKLCVDYMRRMSPATNALKREWLAHRENPQHQPWRYVEPVNREKHVEERWTQFLVRVQDESSSYRPIHADPVHGGGYIIGEAVHWLDLSCWLFENDRPVEIQAWGSARMAYGIYITFQSGNNATILQMPNGTFDYPKEMYEITHDGALFRMEHFIENQYYGRPGIEKEIFAYQRDCLPEIGKQGGLSGHQEKYHTRVKNLTNAREGYETLLINYGYNEMFDGFIDSVINGISTPCDELAGYQATYLAELAIQSIREGHPLPVPVDKWDYFVVL